MNAGGPLALAVMVGAFVILAAVLAITLLGVIQQAHQLMGVLP